MDERIVRLAGDLHDGAELTRRDLGRLAEGLRAANIRLAARHDPLEVLGAAALVQGYYTIAERFFERVARDLNAAPAEGPDWHRRLLRSMTLDRSGVRPAVLREALADRLDELLRFRHLFRNVYVLELDAGRVSEVVNGALGLHTDLEAALRAFQSFLAEVARRG